MVAVEMSADYDGRPLKVLGELIEERKRILGESAQDAVIATGIDALVSLRALTTVAKQYIPRSDVRWGESNPKYITGTRTQNGLPMRRVVYSRYSGGQKKNKVGWQPLEVKYKGKGLKRRESQPHATRSDLRNAWKRFGAIKNRGLAKRVLGVAMNKLSTRQVPLGPARAKVRRIAESNVFIDKTGTFENYGIEIQDTLGYALAALKGGMSSVNTALEKAANKIAGRLCKVAEKKFGERIETPFPEVKNRRVS